MRERNDVRTRYTARHAGKYTAHGEIRRRRIFLFRGDLTRLGRFLFLFIEKQISESSLAEISPRRELKCNLFAPRTRGNSGFDLIGTAISLFFFGIIFELALRSGTRDEDSRLQAARTILSSVRGYCARARADESLASTASMQRCHSHTCEHLRYLDISNWLASTKRRAWTRLDRVA